MLLCVAVSYGMGHKKVPVKKTIVQLNSTMGKPRFGHIKTPVKRRHQRESARDFNVFISTNKAAQLLD